MLLFHGTIKEIDSIFEKGLVQPATQETLPECCNHWHWSSHMTRQPRGTLVFLSPSPLGSKGGDPISFADGWPYPPGSRTGTDNDGKGVNFLFPE